MRKVNKAFGMKYAGILAFSLALFCSCGETPTPDGGDGDEENLSRYITDVYEYMYAPGQHAKTRTPEDKSDFIGEPYYDLYLGGFGGYVIAGFNHNVPNVEGEPDFEIFSSGVDAEPAVVYVMCDENGDGVPNETWYELKGNMTDDAETIRDYALSYYKPLSEDQNIRWRDNRGQSGELKEGNKKDPATGTFTSTYSWWWNVTEGDSITFTGTRLPDAYVNASADSVMENWIVPDGRFEWGYAENNKGQDYDRTTKANKLDISNAIDAQGNPVELQHIRFIKVQTAIFQRAGWLNEISAEVKGARDLHYPL